MYISEKFIGTLGKTYGATTALLAPVAAALFGVSQAYDIYRKYKDSECSDKFGIDYKNCRMMALQRSKGELRKNKSICKRTIDPGRCIEKIDNEIKKVEQRIKKILRSI